MNSKQRRQLRRQQQRAIAEAVAERGTALAVPLSHDLQQAQQDAANAGVAPQVIAPPVTPVRPIPRMDRRGQILVQQMTYAGPLPHPDILRGFNEVVPGSADRIITQFEEQGRHRRKQESRVITHNMVSSSVGQGLAFLLFLVIVVGGGFLIHEGHSLEGSGAVITGVASAIWALHGARASKQQNLSEKKDEPGKAVERRKR